MNKKYFTLIVFFCLLNFSFAQNVGIGTNTPSAKLEISSNNSGILIPRLTTIAKNAILNPPKGLLVYDSTAKQFYYHDGAAWQSMSSSASSFWQQNGIAGNEIKNTNAGGFWSAATIGLDINADNTTNPVTAPVNGAGTRLMWIPLRSAFRAGTVSDVNGIGSKYWDKDSIGLFSFATGFNTRATEQFSFATGLNTTASGYTSTAMGYKTTVSGGASTAMGGYTLASADFSTAMGYSTTASGYYSTAMGSSTKALGDHSTAMGEQTIASGYYSTAMGNYTTASGDYSTAMGSYGNTNGHLGSFIIHDFINEDVDGITRNSRDNQMIMKFGGGFGFYSGGATDASMGFEKTRGLTVYGKGISTYGGGNIYTENGGKMGVNTATPNATLQVNGGVSMPIKEVTGSYAVQDGDYTLEVNLPNNGIATITLPNTNLAPGRIINVVILNPACSVTIIANGNVLEKLGSNGVPIYIMGVNLQCGVVPYKTYPGYEIINGWIKISSWSF